MNHPEIVIAPAFFFMVGYIVWVWVTAVQRRHQVKLMADFHSRLLDKLGSVKDFNEFLQTDGGARLIRDLGSEAPLTNAPQERILRAVQFGSVLVCLGIGLLMLTFFSPVTIQNGRAGFNALGTIALSIGIGFLVSAAASYRLAGALGILMPRADTAGALSSRS